MISFKKIPQLSLLDKILNLLLQVISFVCVMPVVFIEAAILILIAFIRISLHLLWPLQGWVIIDLHKHLIKWNVQGCVMQTSSWRWTYLPVVSILLFSYSGLLWTKALFKMAWELCFHLLCSLPLLGNDRIFYIHEALGWVNEFNHSLWFLIIELVDE